MKLPFQLSRGRMIKISPTKGVMAVETNGAVVAWADYLENTGPRIQRFISEYPEYEIRIYIEGGFLIADAVNETGKTVAAIKIVQR